MLAVVRSVQVTGDAGSQRSTRAAHARQKREEEAAEVSPGLGGPIVPSVTDVAAIAAPALAGDDEMARVEVTMEKLKAENLALQGQLIAGKSAYVACCCAMCGYSGT